MDGLKPAVASSTIIAALIGGLAAAAPLVGITISSDMQAALTQNIGTLVVVICNLVAVISAIVAGIQRAKATKQVGGIFTPDPAKAPKPMAIHPDVLQNHYHRGVRP